MSRVGVYRGVVYRGYLGWRATALERNIATAFKHPRIAVTESNTDLPASARIGP